MMFPLEKSNMLKLLEHAINHLATTQNTLVTQ